MNIKIQLEEIRCYDTEDWTGADIVYINCAASDGINTKTVIARPMGINDGQVREYQPPVVLFEGDVPIGGQISLALEAFDEDAGKDWGQIGGWLTKLANAVADQVEGLPRKDPGEVFPEEPKQGADPKAIVAGLLRGLATAANIFVPLDADDKLGQLKYVMPIPGAETYFWKINGSFLGTRWDYLVRIGVIPTEPPVGVQGEIRSFRSFNFPNRYIRHQNFLGELTEISTDLDQSDASFVVVPGLLPRQRPYYDGGGVAFRSVNFPDHYLRHEGFRLKLQKITNDLQFQKDTTFFIEKGLADPTCWSIRSVNYNTHYIRHRDFHLYLEPADSGGPFQSDATFRIVPPFKKN